MKECKGCGQLRPASDFYKNGTRYCKSNGCHRNRAKQLEVARLRRIRQLPKEHRDRYFARRDEQLKDSQRRYRLALNTLRGMYPDIFYALRDKYMEEGKDYSTARNHALVKLKAAFPEKYKEVRDQINRTERS